MKKLITLSFAFLLLLSVSAQTIEGDALINIVGSRISAPATQNFLSEYEIKNTAGAKYSSGKYGVDMSTRGDTIISMSIYGSSSIYGSFSSKLPRGITFGDNKIDILKKLGKPTTIYVNSGYAEYEIGKFVMTCWFEKGVLTQLSISLK